MMIKSFLPVIFAAAILIAGTTLPAQDHQGHDRGKPGAATAPGKLLPVAEVDAAWAGQARKVYPLDACLTSDEKLGSMGKPSEWVYRSAGQKDRLVVFCCEGCNDDFMKEPAKYLAKLDAAAKAKTGK